MGFSTRHLTPRVGVEITADPETLLNGSHARQIRHLLEHRSVIVFPRADLRDEQQLAFARTLGGVIEQGEKGIFKVTLNTKENAMAEYLRGTAKIGGLALPDLVARGHAFEISHDFPGEAGSMVKCSIAPPTE